MSRIMAWFDDDGYMREWTTAQADDGEGITIEHNVDELLSMDCRLYRLENGKLVYDRARKAIVEKQDKAEDIRARREVECFPVINRGGLWYDLLNENQRNELLDWYTEWLDAPDTLIVPERPSWLD